MADYPVRNEPGTGEITYAGVARALTDMGYSGLVGMEVNAKGDEDVALKRVCI